MRTGSLLPIHPLVIAHLGCSAPEQAASLPASVSPEATTASDALAIAGEAPPPGWKPIPSSRPKGFPGAEIMRVKAFAYDLELFGTDGPNTVCSRPLDPDGTLCSTVAAPGAELSAAQITRLLQLLEDPETFGREASCFLPQHGFVFYDAEGTPVAELSLCFMCGTGEAAPRLPRGDDAGPSFGLSEGGVAALRILCNELGLPKCDGKSPEDFGASP